MRCGVRSGCVTWPGARRRVTGVGPVVERMAIQSQNHGHFSTESRGPSPCRGGRFFNRRPRDFAIVVFHDGQSMTRLDWHPPICTPRVGKRGLDLERVMHLGGQGAERARRDGLRAAAGRVPVPGQPTNLRTVPLRRGGFGAGSLEVGRPGGPARGGATNCPGHALCRRRFSGPGVADPAARRSMASLRRGDGPGAGGYFH